jgi:hypothetical protein
MTRERGSGGGPAACPVPRQARQPPRSGFAGHARGCTRRDVCVAEHERVDVAVAVLAR